VRPTISQGVLSRLLTAAGGLIVLLGLAYALVGAGAMPLAGTIIALIGYGAWFGNYLVLRNTDRGPSTASMLKVFLGLASFGLLFAGLLNVFRKTYPTVPNGYLFADGCVFGVLLIAFHLYTKRPTQA
jgi:hypothetical protein